MMKEKKWGEFCEMFGTTPRNRIIEFFLEMRELDFAIGDLAKETGLNRATAYNTIEDLLAQKVLMPSRKVSGGQLYKLNKDKREIKVLIEVFNLILSRIVNEHPSKEKKQKLLA